MAMNKRKRWFFAGGALLTVAAVFLLVFGEFSLPIHGQASEQSAPAAKNTPGKTNSTDKEADRQASVPVTVAKVELKLVQRTVEVVGSFEGYEEVTVTPKVEGRVIRIHYDVGDIVHPGDVLMEIDPTDYQLAVQEGRKSMESELAKDGLTNLPGPGFDIMKLPTVVRAVNQYRNATLRFNRIDSLYKQKISTKEEWDQAYTDNEVAKATVEQVKIDAEANIAKARKEAAIMETAEQRLRDTKVEVPVPSAAIARLASLAKDVEYTVAKRMISEGEMATRSNPQGVLHLVIDKLLKFKAAVPEMYTGQVKFGQKVQLRVDAYPDKIFEGAITRVSPTVDRLSRTFQIEVLVPNLSRELKAGGFAKASILTRVDANARTVPVEALVTSVGTTKVFVVQDGKAHAVEVKTGFGERNWVEITSEFDPNSTVITSGQNQLVEGTPVKIR
jgi:RND family efflux transporter MFP subunit